MSFLISTNKKHRTDDVQATPTKPDAMQTEEEKDEEITVDGLNQGLSFYSTKSSKNANNSDPPSILWVKPQGLYSYDKGITIDNKSSKHCIINMPAKDQFFCTHCLSTLPKMQYDAHITTCFYKDAASFLSTHCGVCNAKCTPENARVHFNSSTHSSRMAYLKSLVANKSKYYITSSSASIVKPQTLGDLEVKIVVELGFLEDRIKNAANNEDKFKMSPAEKLCTLITQVVAMRRGDNTQVQVDLLSRNKLMALFLGFLSEINSGYQMCHIMNSQDDFVQPAHMLDAVKLVLSASINKLSDPNIRTAKTQQLQLLFSTQEGREQKCLVCNKEHTIKSYKARTSLYGVVKDLCDNIMQSQQ